MAPFGKTVDPKEQVDAWIRTLRQTTRDMDRQIKKIQREEEKAKQSLKEACQEGDRDACKILAMEIVRSRKTCNKIRLSEVHINSLVRQLRNQLSMLKVSGSLAKSSEVMQAMQTLVKMPEFNRTMQDMAKEMRKAGIIGKMMEDAIDVLDEDDLETAADAEVEKVLRELTEGQLGEAPRAVEGSLPVADLAAADVRQADARAPALGSDNSVVTTTSEATTTESMSIRTNNPSSPIEEHFLNITDQLSTVKAVRKKTARSQPHVLFTDQFYAGYAVFFTHQ